MVRELESEPVSRKPKPPIWPDPDSKPPGSWPDPENSPDGNWPEPESIPIGSWPDPENIPIPDPVIISPNDPVILSFKELVSKKPSPTILSPNPEPDIKSIPDPVIISIKDPVRYSSIVEDPVGNPKSILLAVLSKNPASAKLEVRDPVARKPKPSIWPELDTKFKPVRSRSKYEAVSAFIAWEEDVSNTVSWEAERA